MMTRRASRGHAGGPAPTSTHTPIHGTSTGSGGATCSTRMGTRSTPTPSSTPTTTPTRVTRSHRAADGPSPMTPTTPTHATTPTRHRISTRAATVSITSPASSLVSTPGSTSASTPTRRSSRDKKPTIYPDSILLTPITRMKRKRVEPMIPSASTPTSTLRSKPSTPPHDHDDENEDVSHLSISQLRDQVRDLRQRIRSLTPLSVVDSDARYCVQVEYPWYYESYHTTLKSANKRARQVFQYHFPVSDGEDIAQNEYWVNDISEESSHQGALTLTLEIPEMDEPDWRVSVQPVLRHD